jgi:hypothetical protein
MRRVVVVLTVGLLCVVAGPPGVAQAGPASSTCGQAASGDGSKAKPARATLALDGQAPELVTDQRFGRKTGERGLTLIFTVTGCEMADDEPAPQDPPSIYAPKTGDAIPEGALRLNGAPSVEDSRYVVRLKASSGSFDPGSYGGFVEIKAPWMNPARTPVTLSRSEDNFGWPLLCGAVGALLGFLVFALLHKFKHDKLLVSIPQFAIAGLVSVAAGAIAALVTNYSNQDVWVLGDNWWGAGGVGFAAATSGAMAVLLAPVFKTDTAANK